MKGACAKKGWEHGSTAVLYSLYPCKVSRKTAGMCTAFMASPFNFFLD